MWFTCIELQCPALATWEDISLDNHNQTVGSVVNATCGGGDKGFTLDGTTVHVIETRCYSIGEWRPTLPECKGQYISKDTHSRFIYLNRFICIILTMFYSPITLYKFLYFLYELLSNVTDLVPADFTVTITESAHSTTIGTVALSVVCSVFVLAMLLDIPTVYFSIKAAIMSISSRFSTNNDMYDYYEMDKYRKPRSKHEPPRRRGQQRRKGSKKSAVEKDHSTFSSFGIGRGYYYKVTSHR